MAFTMNRYLEQKILTADPVELVRVLYQTAISSVREARTHLREGRIAERARATSCAYAALAELNGSLNMPAAPELTGRLRGLYLYMQGRLVEAGTQQSDVPLAEILGLLTTLAEAWTAALETLRQSEIEAVAAMPPRAGARETLALSA
jgi:flagellar protein FliS